MCRPHADLGIKYQWMIYNLFAVTCQQDGSMLTNDRSTSLYSVRFPDTLVLLYTGCRLVVGRSVTEALDKII